MIQELKAALPGVTEIWVWLSLLFIAARLYKMITGKARELKLLEKLPDVLLKIPYVQMLLSVMDLVAWFINITGFISLQIKKFLRMQARNGLTLQCNISIVLANMWAVIIQTHLMKRKKSI